MKKSNNGKSNKVGLGILAVLTPVVMLFIESACAGIGVAGTFGLLFSLAGLLNLLVFACIEGLFYAIFNRVKIAIIATTVFTVGVSLVNYMLVLFRDEPLCLMDILSVKTAMDVAGTYHLVLNVGAWCGIVLATMWMVLTIVLKSKIRLDGKGKRIKGLHGKKRLGFIVGVIIAIVATGCVVLNEDWLRDHGMKVSAYSQKIDYNNNGYALGMCITAAQGMDLEPDGYSASEIENLAKKYTTDKAVQAVATTRETPNIITVMNESFSDIAVAGDFDTNEDYMPFYRSLTKNTIKGKTHVSIKGGATADSEFEYLTGFTMASLPYRSVPFAFAMNESTPSLEYALKAQGYGGNVAFHPGTRGSYNRSVAYPLLGFDKHVSVEDFDNPERIRAYMSDEADYASLEQQYEEYRASGAKAPFTMFNVTIQNHGDYKPTSGKVDAGIRITDKNAQNEEMEQYLNLVKISDDALKGLIEYFSKVEEPSVIVFFGDHEPAMDIDFVDRIRDNSGREYGSLLEMEEEKYQSLFMIWANFDIPEEDDVEMSLNYLQSYVKDKLGLPMTGYDKYLLDLREEIPAVSSITYIDKTGVKHDVDELNNKYGKLLKQYARVQYNGLFDTKNRAYNFFYIRK